MVIIMNIKGQWIHYNTMIIYDYNHYNTIIMNDNTNGQSWMVRSQIISGPFFVSSNTTDFYTTRHITGELLQGSRSRSAGNFRKPGMRGMVEWLRWRVQDPPCKVVWKTTQLAQGCDEFSAGKNKRKMIVATRPPCSCASVFFHLMVPLRRPFMNSWRMMPAGHLSDS
jgi:hypothetical protein